MYQRLSVDRNGNKFAYAEPQYSILTDAPCWLSLKAMVSRMRIGKSVFSYSHPFFWAPYSFVGDDGGRPNPAIRLPNPRSPKPRNLPRRARPIISRCQVRRPAGRARSAEAAAQAGPGHPQPGYAAPPHFRHIAWLFRGVRGRLLAGGRACVVGGIMLSIGRIWIKHSDTILPHYPGKFLKHPSN
jgi:hypothetical protein